MAQPSPSRVVVMETVPQQRSFARGGYLHAVGLVAAALAVTLWLLPLIAPVSSVAFFVAIALIARHGSLGATLMVAVVSALSLDLFVEPSLLVLDHPAQDLALTVALIAVALVVKASTDELRAAERARGHLQGTAAQAIDAEERVRREIAELLHGRVQSRLVAAWSELRMLEPVLERNTAEAKSRIRAVSDEIDDIREREIRQASCLLHPVFIREGLGPGVDALAEHYERELAIQVEISPRLRALDTPVRNRIPESLRLAAFRVVEEALANVLRHASASAVHIRLDLDALGRLDVVIEDNGRGFDPANTATSATDTLPAGTGIACYQLQALNSSAAVIAASDIECVQTNIASAIPPQTPPMPVSIVLNQGAVATISWGPATGASGYILVELKNHRTQNLRAGQLSATDDTGGTPDCYVVLSRGSAGVAGMSDLVCGIPGSAVNTERRAR